MGYSEKLPYYASRTQVQMAYHATEAKIVRRVIRALKKNGTPVTSIWDGEESTAVRTEREAMATVFNLDWAALSTETGSYVLIHIGNAWECITDYTLDLEAALAEAEAWIAKNDPDNR